MPAGCGSTPPEVPPPDECPPRRLPDFSSTSIFDRIDVRLAQGLSFEEITEGSSGSGNPTSALWARVPGHLEPSAATLAIIGDYVSGGVSQPLGRRAMSRSLDNTLRMVQLEPTEWVLCHIRIQAVVDGYGQGAGHALVGERVVAGHGQPVDERAPLGRRARGPADCRRQRPPARPKIE